MRVSTNSVLKSAAAAVVALGLGLGTGVANAQPLVAIPQVPSAPAGLNLPGLPLNPATPSAKQLVAFGDSFTANAGKEGPRGLEPGQNLLVPNCSTDMENWPKIAGQQLGMSVGDWSCNGTGGLPRTQLMAYVEAAIQYGDLGPGTEKVVLMYGGLDAHQWVDAAGKLVNKGELNPSAFRETIRLVADRVREVAPGAQVYLASYPEFATNDQVCLFNVAGQVNPIPAPGATQVQEALRDSIRDAAAYSGAGFVDVYQATLGHGTCNPKDEDRYVAGIVDPVLGPMVNHPTVHGEYAMAGIIANGIR